ncbi:MAG TPA: transcription termination/antitermination protein NusG, partial [Pirellulaceae bacterium]|nr:transcription termination/antitermination protein NusG [Pirellulaceae bacterium]
PAGEPAEGPPVLPPDQPVEQSPDSLQPPAEDSAPASSGTPTEPMAAWSNAQQPAAESPAAEESAEAEAEADELDEPDEPDEPEPDVPFAAPLEFIDETIAEEDLKFDWFILKVQVNREDSIKDALLRRVKMNGLDRYFKEIVVPTEDVVEFTKTGKKRVVKKKLYPGYILVNMSVSDESWFMVRETPGIGDFTGASGKPTPMDPKDVERILRSSKVLPDEEGEPEKIGIPFKDGDRVRVKEGYFQNFEGDVDKIDQATGRVTVMVNIFGRSTPVELDHWQIEAV